MVVNLWWVWAVAISNYMLSFYFPRLEIYDLMFGFAGMGLGSEFLRKWVHNDQYSSRSQDGGFAAFFLILGLAHLIRLLANL